MKTDYAVIMFYF